MVDVHLVGHVCVDLTPVLTTVPDLRPGVLSEVGPLGIEIGGVVGNGARAAHAMGRSVALAATVGDDALGSLCRDALESIHPGEVFLTESPARATSYSVVVQPAGADRSFWHHTGANDDFHGDCLLRSAPFLHYGYPTLTPSMTRNSGEPTVALFQRARVAGMATSLDLAYCADNSPLRHYDWEAYFRKVLPLTDVFCPSWDDILSAHNKSAAPLDRGHLEATATELLATGAGMVLITAGQEGSYLATGDAHRLEHLARAVGVDPRDWANLSEWVPAAPVARFVSSNGAGDTFKVAFLLSSLGAPDPRVAARRAAAVVARHIGGLPLAGV